MAAPFSTTGKTLAFLPLLGVASPFAQAAEAPFPSLSPFPNQPEPWVTGSRIGQPAAIAAPVAPLAAELSMEAYEPQFLAQVLPSAGTTNTQVSVDETGQQFEIRGGIQAGENLFHRFDQLDLEAGQSAEFLTNPGLEVLFSQIGGDASSIDGLLKVSGSSADLFLLNPNGIVFGPNARLDLGGSFTATTADRLGVGEQWIELLGEGITAQTAVAGAVEALAFSADAPGGAIANQAQLAVVDGESLRLLGYAVVNTGSLTAPGGEVTILSASGGQRVSLGGGLLKLDLAGSTTGTSPASRLSNGVAQPVAEATGLSLNADGSVSLQAGTSIVAGNVDVSSTGEAGGQVRILGNEVQLTDAVVDASGAAGGEIYVGGDYQGRGEMLRAVSTRLDETSVLRADGIASTSNIRPDGGEVVVWSDGQTEFAGTASARSLAPGGDGGLVETSGKQQLAIASTADVSTASVDGATGQWLIDPVNLTVVNGAGAGAIVGGVNDPGSSTIDAATVEAGLNGNNIRLQADNSITVNAPINTSANGSGGDLNLDSPNLNLNERIILRAGSELSGTATTVNVGANGGIQNAVDAAVAGGTVNLAAATYREGSEVDIGKQIRLQGQGSANTILSGDPNGDGNGIGNQADNHRVLDINSGADGSVISGITIRNAAQSDAGAGLENTANDVTIEDSAFINNRLTDFSQDGGAIHTRGERLSIRNTRFESNNAGEDGGAIDIENGSVEITDSIFRSNLSVGGHGGAIDVDPNGSLTVANTIFENNVSQYEGGALYTEAPTSIINSRFEANSSILGGGAIFLDSSSSNSTIQDTIFIGNTSVRFGGAIVNQGLNSQLNINGGEFSNNQVTSSNSALGDGGAIFISGSGLTIIDGANFFSNTATFSGGAIAAQGNSRLAISNTSFLNNQSQGDNGGGIFVIDNSQLQLRDSLLNGNTADKGGGIYQDQNAQSTILNTRFTNNQAATDGGAISLISTGTTQLRVTESTFDSNSAQDDGGGVFLDARAGGVISFDQTAFTNNDAVSGGGIYKTDNSNVSVSNSVFERNTATEHGGGLFAAGSGGTITIADSNFVQNVAGIDGGGIRITNNNLLLSNSRILTNQAGFGGGVELSIGSNAQVVNSLFQGNTATTHGGAISIDDTSIATLSNNQLLNNQASQRGGAIHASSGFTLDSSLVQGNTATVNGGGISLDGTGGDVLIRSTTLNGNIASSGDGGGLAHTGNQTTIIEESLFSGNRSAGNGGAIDLNPSGSPLVQILNSTISSNTAAVDGAGLSLGSIALAELNNVTIANNDANNSGGGVFNHFGGSLIVQNSIAAQNRAANNPDVSGSVTSLGNNIVQVRGTSTGYIGADLPNGTDPLLLSLANNGGLTETHAVRANSLARDGGNVSATAADQRGLAAVNQRDIGAYELDNDLRFSVTGSGQTQTVNQAFASPVGVTVTDSLGALVAGLNIDVTPPITGASASLGTLQTNSSGIASTTATANTVAGSYTVNLGINGNSSIGSLSLTNTADAPSQIAVLNGNNQSTVVNTVFANPLQVAVTDQFGNQVPNQTLNLSLPSSGASASAGAIALTTDSAGQASTFITANTVAGSYAVDVAAGSLSNSVSLTNLPDLPSQLTVNSGDGQSTVVNTAFANPLQVTVTDQFGNAVSGATVNLNLPSTGASSAVGAIALTTDASGQAATALTANTVAGDYAIALTSGGATNSTSLTNLPDTPAQLLLNNGDNQSTVVNTAFANPLQVSVTDQFGNAIPGVTVDLSLPGSDASANAGAGTLTTDAAGQATTGLVANTIAGGYSLGLSAGSLANTVQLTNLPDAPARLDVLAGDNQTQVVDAAFSDPLLVQVSDQFGNVIPGAIVNLSLPSTGASAQAGSVSLTTNGLGQATTQFIANTTAGNYAVGLASGSANNSISLSNQPDSPAQLNLLGGNNQATQINTDFANQLQVQVSDQFGNVIPGATVTFTAPAAGSPSAELSAAEATTDGAGQSQVLATANDQAGSYQVRAQAGAATAAFELENTDDTADAPLPELPTVTELPLASVPQSQPVEQPSGGSLTSSAPLSFVNTTAIEAIDSSFSSAYTNHWGTPASSGVTIAETREVLQNATEAHGVKSAIVYGLFVPQAQTNNESFGATQVASMALNRRAETSEQRDDDQLMLVLVPNEGPPIQQLVSVTRQEVLQQARLFRMAVSDPYDDWSYKPLARQLYSWMLGPMEPELERLQLDNIMYVMDAGLRTLPLAAMMKGDEFAIERYGISLIPSVDLMETNFGTSAPSSQIVAAGATEFERLNDLPAVELELDAIASQNRLEAAQQNVSVLFNEAFTQENLVQTQQQSQSNMLHLATHGEFNAGDLGSSYLQFWDDQLTLDDISQLGWDELELLILSACQTAISSPEAELGFAGLAAATGVESTIGSLWSVSDVGTLGLMSEFYGQLNQTPLRFEALRQAQMAMLRGETRIADQKLKIERGEIELPEEWNLPESADFSHPFYWSGFTLVGNPWW